LPNRGLDDATEVGVVEVIIEILRRHPALVKHIEAFGTERN
jgi:hypothetical protein